METWTWQKWAVFAAPGVLVLLVALAGLVLHRTFRSRYGMVRQLRGDPDVHEWLVVFNWSRKVLYLPLIVASLLGAGVMSLWPEGPHGRVVAALWLTVFFLNFVVDEYEVNLRVLLVVALAGLALFLWLSYLDWLLPVLDAVRTGFDASTSAAVYLTIGAIFLLAIAISWLRGLFHYTAITPNYLNLQSGPTETGELIDRERFSTRVDTGDFLERVLGFGRVIITYTDPHRPPLALLVGRIGTVAARLESVRAKLAVE